MLFERICRKNGIKQLLTRPFSPTTIGKVERWHQTLQTDFLNDAGPFASVAEARAAVDAWRAEYNTERPHQSLDMATPASRFRPSSQTADPLSLWMPADLEPVTGLPPAPGDEPTMAEPASWPDAVEVERAVPPSGNLWVGGQQFWLSPARAGQKVTLWIDTASVHVSIGGWRVKTVPSRLTEVDLARLRCADARPAGPPPAGPSPGALAASKCVEVDRLVNGIGGVTLLNRLILVGSPLAGQRARLRLDGQLMHVITQDGTLWRTLPCPIPPGQRHRLQGVRLAGPAPLPEVAATVQRRVSSRGGIQVARQRIQVGMTHADKIVTVVPENNSFRLVIDGEDVGCRAPHHQRPNRPLQGLRHSPRKAVNPMPEVRLDAGDAAELAEMLQFLSGRLARDPARLAASLEEFVGHPAYGITQLRQDLDRFVFLLGGSDGEPLFGPASN